MNHIKQYTLKKLIQLFREEFKTKKLARGDSEILSIEAEMRYLSELGKAGQVNPSDIDGNQVIGKKPIPVGQNKHTLNDLDALKKKMKNSKIKHQMDLMDHAFVS